MKKETYLYLAWVLVITNQLYQEIFGLNTIVIASVTIPVFLVLKPQNARKPKWWLGAGLFLASGISIFIDGSGYAGALFILSAMFFMCIQVIEKQSLPFSILQTIQSWTTGFYYFFHRFFNMFEGREDANRKKSLANFLLIVFTLTVLIVFLKLYQSADETFAAYTAWINLDWISWGFLAFYGLLSFMLYGLFFFKQESTITGWEDTLKNEISRSYVDKIQEFFTVKTENRVGVILLVLLNAMLLLYNSIDIKFVTTDLYAHAFTSNYSQIVHGGINSLITSIILVILIVTFLFRGQLNFFNSKIAKGLALFWLVQNSIMIVTSSLKNWEYIAHWGLTYKRIGVFVYLILALIGIGFTIYKLISAKSIWFLIRATSLSFFGFFILFSLPNWDRQIAQFNLNEIEKERIDYDYLLDLGSSSIAELVKFEKLNRLEDEVLDVLKYRASDNYYFLSQIKESTSWRSMNIADKRDLEIIENWSKLDENLSYHWDEY